MTISISEQELKELESLNLTQLAEDMEELDRINQELTTYINVDILEIIK